MNINEELRTRFIEFARLKLAADGSDSYIMGAVELARRKEEPYWYAGVFTTFYAPPAPEVFTSVWSRQDVLQRPDAVLEWVEQHWEALPLSGARRTNRMGPHKLVETLLGYARWIEDDGIDRLRWDIRDGDFDVASRGLLRCVPNHGRYTGLKLYETLRRIGLLLPAVSDIRPRGGRTPRKSLRLIYGHDSHADDRRVCEEANSLADGLRREIPTSWFNVEMLLCNFSKAVKGGYYPGHALDRELSHAARCKTEFSADMLTRFYAQRVLLYPVVCRGEVHGWDSTRKDLEFCYPRYGYLWSDLVYDFNMTTDLSCPSRRDVGPVTELSSVRGYGEEVST